ncbi:hypothetical protein GEV33_010872 [Tenebrio molitor]|uniref:Reverse transcriptase domain-containing protein n=1 Tax=Tenebrio molitor TaxID=7067 RepID=A0A8J6HBT8_TENMO|nr:hypothetical protein GEV33_010872 [Tenebrio molitor]
MRQMWRISRLPPLQKGQDRSGKVRQLRWRSHGQLSGMPQVPSRRAPATTAAPAPSAAPKTQPAPVKQPAAGTKSATKSFADATASKKPAAPAQTPRPAPAQKNSTAEKIITEVLMAIQTSTSTEQILAKVLAIIPKTAFFNARSLRTTRNELEVFADSHDLDVILVNETFLRADDPDPKIRGFTLYRTDRTNGAGGGTAIFVRRTLPHYPNALPALQSLEATAVTIETANGPLTLISCYHRPQDRLRENDITNILDTGASVIAAGDFNSKHLTWGSRETNRNGRILFDLADATDFLIEAPPEPTYYDSRADILDIALIKNVPFQIRLHVSLALNSDHMPVLMHIGDEANDANTNITIRTTNWPRFAEILETDFGPITRIESVEDLESAAGPLEDKIGSLKKKAPGSDNISNTALKLLPPKVVVALAAIFNASLRLCHFPSRWKNATVIFIPKPGKNSKLPQSYRPISLLSSIGKVHEKVILTRLVKVTDENSTIPDEQFGFRPKHSTVDQLINVTEFIAKGFGQNQSTGAIFLDVAKAFDTVWHDGLVYKLHAAGVPMAMVRLLNSFLNRRVFHAKILSTQREIQAGVPQGSVLSPTLYAIFTADIPKPDNTKIALYADDTAILVRSWSPEIISRDFQGAVENLESWFRTWRIDVNPEKSSAILFTKRHFRPVGEVAMFNRVIPWTTVVKYLGVKFDNHLTFIPQIEHAKTRALIVRGQLNSLVCRRSKLSIKNKITIYRQIVRPAMTYGFVVWGNVSNTQLHKLQVVQNKFLRAAFNAPWFGRNSQLHREADLPLIKDFLLDVAEKFFENAAQHPNPLVRDAVDYDEHLPLRHKRPKCLLLRQD